MAQGLEQEPLDGTVLHLCLDMQNLFAPGGPWATPWMPRVLPVVAELAARFPERTIFTRFVPPQRPDAMPGRWRAYYEKWRAVTREHVDPALLGLIPALTRFAPPAAIIDKTRYSAFAGTGLHRTLQERGARGLMITGSETDVCVLATVLDAVDLGYRVIVVQDGVCSSSDQGHDALMELYLRRYSIQIECAAAEAILRRWV
jgi:nicotinamidase-related amidase